MLRMPGPDAFCPQEAVIRRSLVLAGALALAKTLAGLHSGSLGVLASALDSAMDLASSGLNLIFLRLSRRPPNPEHPYGLGKTEALAGLVQGGLIALSGAWLLLEAAKRFLHGSSLHPGPLELGVMALSTGASLWHSRTLGATLKTSPSSIVLRAETAHFSMDVLSNGSVLAALLAVRWFAMPVWDILISFGISLYILKEALRLLEVSVQELLDRSLPRGLLGVIQETILAHDARISGFHELRARKAGPRLFIDFHIEIREVEDFQTAHEITETLIDRLHAKIPNADFTVHYDPQGER